MVKHHASINSIKVRALSYDDALPLQHDNLWSAHLLRIFDNAITMVDNSGNPVTLLDSSRRNGPSRILLELSEQSRFRQWPVDDDACFILHKQYLCDSGFSVFIDLSGAKRWNLPSRLNGALLSSHHLSQNIQVSFDYLIRHSVSDDRQFFSSVPAILNGELTDSSVEQDNIPYGALLVHLAKVYHYIKRGSELSLFDSVERMIGLGRGLTPSGDDIICGILCAFHTARKADLLSPFHAGFLSRFKQRVGHYGERTTFLSHSFLTWAGEGRCSEEVFSFCEKILTDKFFNIERWGPPLIAMGASSGREVMLGALVGIGALCREHFTGKEANCSG